MSAAQLIRSGGMAVILLTLLVHTIGLICRVYISGRPPVTNLYSSALFIAWGAVVLCMGLEVVFKNGVGSLVGRSSGLPRC